MLNSQIAERIKQTNGRFTNETHCKEKESSENGRISPHSGDA